MKLENIIKLLQEQIKTWDETLYCVLLKTKDKTKDKLDLMYFADYDYYIFITFKNFTLSKVFTYDFSKAYNNEKKLHKDYRRRALCTIAESDSAIANAIDLEVREIKNKDIEGLLELNLEYAELKFNLENGPDPF